MIVTGQLQWPIVPPCQQSDTGASSGQWTRAQDIAVDWLWAITGRRLGVRQVTWRPEVTPRARGRVSVDWVDPARFELATALGLSSRPSVSVPLPPPASQVVSVTVDGQLLDPSAYLLQGNNLRRMDGDTWPVSQDITVDASQPGTWQLVYMRGIPVPEQGQWAAGVLTCELAKAMVNPAKCAWPSNATTVSRNGTTVNLDAVKLTERALTGIRDVDRWVRQVNPRGLQRPPQVWSPDAAPDSARQHA